LGGGQRKHLYFIPSAFLFPPPKRDRPNCSRRRHDGKPIEVGTVSDPVQGSHDACPPETSGRSAVVVLVALVLPNHGGQCCFGIEGLLGVRVVSSFVASPEGGQNRPSSHQLGWPRPPSTNTNPCFARIFRRLLHSAGGLGDGSTVRSAAPPLCPPPRRISEMSGGNTPIFRSPSMRRVGIWGSCLNLGSRRMTGDA
jgi:hypothetical protein